MNNEQLITDIQKVREKNNILWMNLLRLAFKHAPKEAADIMSKVSSNDSKINKLSRQLGGMSGDIPEKY